MKARTEKDLAATLRQLKTHEIVGLTMSSDVEMREHACLELGHRRIPATGVELFDCREDPEPVVRAASCRAAAEIEGPGVRRFLTAMLQDPDELVVKAARVGLTDLDRPPVPEPPPSRANTGDLGQLLEEARNPDPLRRASALRAMAPFHDPRVGALMGEKLEDPFPAVRAAAAAGVAAHPRAGVTKRLVEMMEDPSFEVRREVARALGSAGAGFVVLVEALGDDFLAVRLAATTALRRMGGERVVGELHQAARTWVPGSPWLLEALIDLGEDVREHAPAWLEHPYSGVRGMALEWIFVHPERRLRRAVEQLRKDPEEWLRAEVEDVLKKL